MIKNRTGINVAKYFQADEKGEILEREIETLLSGSSGIEKGSSSSPLLDSSKSLDKDA